jgi:hypothetical protein
MRVLPECEGGDGAWDGARAGTFDDDRFCSVAGDSAELWWLNETTDFNPSQHDRTFAAVVITQVGLRSRGDIVLI